MASARAQAPPPAADPVTALVASLEQQYSGGLQLYRSGQLDEARQQFDATVDRLLSSPYDIRATPRLQTELDSLLDRIQALESDVLAVGGLNQPRPLPTPLERIPELTFPLDAATRASIEREAEAELAKPASSQLPIQLNDAVMRYVHYFSTTGRADLIEGLRRAGRYQAMADATFTAAGVPTDLFYMAELESDFNPQLGHSRGARGMWQFEPSRADDYDLKRTPWVDERDDPVKATAAAAHHLKDLYAEFGDWYLAMAAYNAGPATIQRAVARTGYADYWKLSALGALPKGVRDYVPIVLAMALIARDPQRYGVDTPQPDPPLSADQQTLAAATDLRLAAECAGVTVADLQRLNPSLLHLRAPAGFSLNLPVGAGKRFSEALSLVPPMDRLSWRMHWVAAGETWGSLSRRYQISVTRIATANHASTEEGLRPGQPLAIPVSTDPPAGAVASKRKPAARAQPKTSAKASGLKKD